MTVELEAASKVHAWNRRLMGLDAAPPSAVVFLMPRSSRAGFEQSRLMPVARD